MDVDAKLARPPSLTALHQIHPSSHPGEGNRGMHPSVASEGRAQAPVDQDGDVVLPDARAAVATEPSQPSGAGMPESLLEKKRKRAMEEPLSAPPSAGLPDETEELRTNGSGGSARFGIDAKMNKRLKVPFKEYLGRNRGPRTGPGAGGRFPLDHSRLPANIWHEIFLACTPVSLARLTRVNKLFHKFLTEPTGNDTAAGPGPPSDEPLEGVSPERIWAASRQLYFPDMPEPLEGFTEAEMWRLLAGRRCQFCGRYGDVTGDIYGQGLMGSKTGEDDLMVVWAFAARSCAPCLKENSEKEIDVLISSSVPSVLLAALPFIFLTPELGLITATHIQLATPPPTLQMAKHYSKAHLQKVKSRFEDVKSHGSAATEDWLTSLPVEGKRRIADTARFERWDYHGGVTRALRTLRPASQATPVPDIRRLSTAVTSSSHFSSNDHGPVIADRLASHPEDSVQSMSGGFVPPRAAVSPSQLDRYHSHQGSFQQPRVGRTIHEVNELKAARRSEIERRCLELQPPILPNVLNQMESFQNALQISTPLTESAWTVLKPLLEAQREAAERKEQERVTQSRLLQAKYEERRQQEAQQKEAKEAWDREWEEAQNPIREQLGQYADEIIKDRWMDGQTITHESSPKFAADVLIYVRQRFYQRIAEEDAAAHAARQEVKRDPAKGPFTRRLTLENMKWLFDTKIKPFTEQFRKELFLCRVCGDNSKFYGFEGVIQHYAAKHTNTLSMGSVVVHWRAEWPEFSPFHPDPNAAKAALFPVPPTVPTPGHIRGPTVHPPYPAHVVYPQSPGPMPPGRQGYASFSPGPYGQLRYPGQFPGQQHYGPFAPPPPPLPPPNYPGPPAYPELAPQGFPRDHPGPYPPTNSGYQGFPGGYQGPPTGFPGIHGPPPGQGSQSFTSPYPPHAYPIGIPGSAPSLGQGHGSVPGPYPPPAGAGPSHAQPNAYQFPGSAPVPPAPNVPGFPPGGSMYQAHLEEMASMARNVWSGVAGIKDLPSSVRVYVVIHKVVTGFKERFSHEPSLAMFMDGLANHPAMKQLNLANGLACKACSAGGVVLSTSLHSHPTNLPAGDRKSYTLPALLSHFQMVHLERGAPPTMPLNEAASSRLDWKIDMIELPETPVISNLLHAPGMDDSKLSLIAQVFPHAFPRPLPVLGRASNTGPVPIMQDAGETSRTTGPPKWRFHDSGYMDSNDRGYADSHGVHGSHPDHAQDHPDSTKSSYSHQSQGLPAPYPRAGRPSSTNLQDYETSEERHSPAHESQGYHEPQDRKYNGAFRPRQQRRFHEAAYPVYPAKDIGESRRHVPGSTGSSRYAEQDSSSQRYNRRKPTHDLRYAVMANHQEEKRDEGHGTPAPTELPRNQTRTAVHDTLDDDSQVEPAEAFNPHMIQEKPQEASDREFGASLAHREMISEGSEDGEVGSGVSREQLNAHGQTPVEGFGEVDRILNECLPGESTETLNQRVDKERREDTSSKDVRPEERDAAQHGRSGFAEGPDVHKSTRVLLAPEHMRESPVSIYPPVPGTEDKGIASVRVRMRQDIRGGPYPRSPRHEQPVEPAAETDPRYHNNTIMYHSERHTTETGRRPRSRYERYENLRQDKSRARSRSPRRLVQPGPEEVRYHRSPIPAETRYEQSYRAHSPMGIYHEEYPAENTRPQNIHPTARYRSYAPDSRVYPPSYAVPMEYVPVRRLSGRSPPPPGTYHLVETPPQAAPYTRYPTYDAEVPARAVYDERGPVYHRRVYHSEEPGRGSHPPPRY